jgi:putative aldouronate transport system permease protein
VSYSLSMKQGIQVDTSTKVVRFWGYVLISVFSLLCLLPFVLMISSSFSSEKAIMAKGFSLIPRDFTTFAYKILFQNPDQIIGSYLVTIIITTIGTSVGVFIIAMTGYALQRPDFQFRNGIAFYIYFTTLFSGGLVPFYILISKHLHLRDNYLAVLLPSLMGPWVIILMKNFMKSIPHSITESAKIDGAGDFTIFLRLILPLSKPALATIGLFQALWYWNEWYYAMLFLSPNVKYRPLQLFLYITITSAEFIRNSAASSHITGQDIPLETMKMATAVVSTGPLILFYPLVQKYFIKGITIGAVKG